MLDLHSNMNSDGAAKRTNIYPTPRVHVQCVYYVCIASFPSPYQFRGATAPRSLRRLQSFRVHFSAMIRGYTGLNPKLLGFWITEGLDSFYTEQYYIYIFLKIIKTYQNALQTLQCLGHRRIHPFVSHPATYHK